MTLYVFLKIFSRIATKNKINTIFIGSLNKMKYLLSEISKIHPGVYIKSTEFVDEGSHVYLNLRDFDEDFQLNNELTRVDFEGKSQFIADKNSILFSVRIKFKAYQLPQSAGEQFVASTSFVILKPDENRILKDYLIWFLNHSEELKKLNETQTKSTRMPYLNLKTIQNLVIDVPHIEKQKEIVQINKLLEKEKKLTHNILELKEIYIQNLLNNTAKL